MKHLYHIGEGGGGHCFGCRCFAPYVRSGWNVPSPVGECPWGTIVEERGEVYEAVTDANPAAPYDEFGQRDYEILNVPEPDYSLVTPQWAVPNLLTMWDRIRALEAELAAIRTAGREATKVGRDWIGRAEKAEAELTKWEKANPFLLAQAREIVRERTRWKDEYDRLQERHQKMEAEVVRLKAENNTLKITILEAGLTPPGWVELAGGKRGKVVL